MTAQRGKPPAWGPEAGAALVTVLVLLAVMAVLATALVEAARFSLARLHNQEQMSQARWYLFGAERVAAARAGEAIRALEGGGADFLWQGFEASYPIDGGAVSLTVRDGSNCFNLNSLITGDDEGGTASNPAAQVEFLAIIEQSGAQVFNAEGLAAALTDYLDTDQIPLPGGAEDEPGAAPDRYRTANVLIGDVSELLAVRGFTPDIVARLAPFVCVRPRAAVSMVNINSLQAQDAPFLTAMFGGALSLQAAQALIAARPLGGWRDVETFFDDPRLAALEPSDGFKARFGVRPRYLVMIGRVRWQGVEESSAALIEIGPPSRIVRRVLGAQVTERSV